MATGYLTSAGLIDEVKRSGLIPTAQQTFTDTDFLAFANQEMRIAIVPSILSNHQEYFVRDTPGITLVANQNNYPIPYRAIGGKFREVFYKDTNGNLRSMSRISPDDRPYYQQSNFQNRYVLFYIQGNDIVIIPDVGPNPTGTLVFSYFLRPNELVSATRVATITNIAVGATTTDFSVDQIPTGFSTSIAMDTLQTNPGHKTYNFDIFPTNVDTVGKVITFNNTDLDTSIIVGDYIAFAGECIIPQIPADMHDMLAQRTAARCLQALGDTQGYQTMASRNGEIEVKIGNLINNRSEGSPQKIVNLTGGLRNAKIKKRGWL